MKQEIMMGMGETGRYNRAVMVKDLGSWGGFGEEDVNFSEG